MKMIIDSDIILQVNNTYASSQLLTSNFRNQADNKNLCLKCIKIHRLHNVCVGHVSAHTVPRVSRCVDDNWNSPRSSRECSMEIWWTDIGVGNLQHNST